MSQSPPYVVEMHPKLPIMMTRFEAHFVFENDARAYTLEARQTLDAQATPVFYLFDLTRWHIMSFGELMQAAAQAARGSNSNFHHPMNRYTLIVTHDPLVSMSAEGMQSDAYGNAKIKVFSSIEDAIAFVKAELK